MTEHARAVLWEGDIGIMEKKMETVAVLGFYWGYIRAILGFYTSNPENYCHHPIPLTLNPSILPMNLPVAKSLVFRPRACLRFDKELCK